MKKIFLSMIIVAFSVLSFTSCEKDPIGGTTTEAMAGEWYVTGVAVDANGDIVYDDADLFGLGHFHLDTYNTADDAGTEIWIDDLGNFWDFKVKASIDLKAQTFNVADAQNVSYDCKVTITDGKILKGAAKTPSGAVADSISFLVTFDDDTYPVDYGFSAYRIAGYRYTGLANDN